MGSLHLALNRCSVDMFALAHYHWTNDSWHKATGSSLLCAGREILICSSPVWKFPSLFTYSFYGFETGILYVTKYWGKKGMHHYAPLKNIVFTSKESRHL